MHTKMIAWLLASIHILAISGLLGADKGSNLANKRSFVIDYENDRFLKDGQPFRFISGTLHYYQIPKALWRDRMEKSRAAGLNMIQTYVPWYKHEQYPGVYDFENENDLLGYLELAQNLSLLVSFRHGPYIDAEQDMGGFPWWLLKDSNMTVRGVENKWFVEATEKWFSVLLPKIRPLLYVNGGPIIMVQIANEYGSFGCDHRYPKWLYDTAVKHLGTDDLIYFTADQSQLSQFKCGRVNGTLSTANFGVKGTTEEVVNIFKDIRKVMPKGPLVNSEFYPGWYDRWGQDHATLTTGQVLDTLKDIWHMNASVNMYAIHGGTNWGYQAGSAYLPPFRGVTTSYDFDAPITEAGDITQKYLALRSTIENLTGNKINYSIPTNSTKYGYNTEMEYLGTVLDLVYTLSYGENITATKYPLTFEDINFPFGFILYEHTLEKSGSTLVVNKVRDRAYVILDGTLLDIIQREENNLDYKKIRDVKYKQQSKLQILVENQGRVAYGPEIIDRKGLLGNVTLDGKILINWIMYPVNLSNIFVALQNRKDSPKANHRYDLKKTKNAAGNLPSVYLGYFMADQQGDTFFDSTQWQKGQLFINGRNIGRYWPAQGPQLTLYVPKCFLNWFNQILIFELEQAKNCSKISERCQASFIDHPKFGKSGI